MSVRFQFKISKKCFLVNSTILLAGIITASFFLMLSPAELIERFSAILDNYFSFGSGWRILKLILQEYFWLAIMIVFTAIPFGKFGNLIILYYKGFSIGAVASVFASIYRAQGIKHITLLLFPPNILYVVSLCLAAQISLEIAANSTNRGRHGRAVPTDKRAYIICFIITTLGALIESYIVPLIYGSLF